MPLLEIRYAGYTAGQKRFSTISHFGHDVDLIKISEEVSLNPNRSSYRVKQTVRAEPRRSMNGIVECSTALFRIMALAVADRPNYAQRGPDNGAVRFFSRLGIVGARPYF
jgi:hypothetical protein